MYDIINKKKRGLVLTSEEIYSVVEGYTNGDIHDYQMSALLMAIYFNGMNAEETTALTLAMVDSGERVDLSSIRDMGTPVDKHSTGGVGDKTTLVVVPILAALGLPVAKMSGRGLGHTGGTVDKLEAIPGFKTNLLSDEFLSIVKKHGLSVVGQSANLAPADKKIYSLRDVTATVDSIPLIAASIMSKKIAAGAEYILLDVKTGNGAFMKDLEQAKLLASAMVDIGIGCGRKTAALITDMSVPLGSAIGNSLELIEVIQVLKGENSHTDIAIVCNALAVEMLMLATNCTQTEARLKVDEVIKSGKAFDKLVAMVEAQGGDSSYITNPDKFPKASNIIEVLAPKTGYIGEMDTEGIGIVAMMLGAGRETPTDNIDYSAGIKIFEKTGDFVGAGYPIAELHTNKGDNDIIEAIQKFLDCVKITQENELSRPQLIYQ